MSCTLEGLFRRIHLVTHDHTSINPQQEQPSSPARTNRPRAENQQVTLSFRISPVPQSSLLLPPVQ